MSRSRWFITWSMAIAATIVTATTVPADEGTVLRIQVIGSGGTTEGTCFLIHQERHEQDVVHYFLTSAHLLNPEAVGERRSVSLRLRLFVDQSSVIDTSGSSVLFPGGTQQGLDVAIVKAVSTNTHLIPLHVSLEPPEADEVFVVRGHQGARLTVLTERVRFRSTRLVLGDRTVADVRGLLGAPAIIDGDVFGLLSECSSTRVPIITLLSAARHFLSLGIPRWTPRATSTADVGVRSR
jgi:hypothetical protein